MFHPRVESKNDLGANGSTSGKNVHPEGPNIGPGSSRHWFSKDPHYPERTDLLHTGHAQGGKLVIVMVGVPGRGKTYIARKVARYLRWINYRTRVFSLARMRQEQYGEKQSADFYNPSNEDAHRLRMEVLRRAVSDMMKYLNRGGEVAILDGTNVTKDRRKLIRDAVAEQDGFSCLFIESVCDDPEVIQSTLSGVENFSPDFIASDDFARRVDFYSSVYETVDDNEGMLVRTHNQGARICVAGLQGFLPSKLLAFISNLHGTTNKPVYMTRHGESEFNTEHRIGGDSPLSEAGRQYALALSDFVEKTIPKDELCVWSSTMRRARQTANPVVERKLYWRYVEWRALREIEVGVCDGLTYQQVKEQFPSEFAAREENKLRYRYPRGESYLDLISRLEPVIIEFERQAEPLLIVAHQAVLRCLYAYFLDLPEEEVPYLSIPLHTVIKLEHRAFGWREQRFTLAST
mmetsp:Transcript_7457/g.21717  ORF Transcript_7457/g.21717 Transcript_7457/m.21717 type:complete len:462 (+) Transcript_7457:79-1464(+)